MVFLFKDKSISNVFFLVVICIAVHTHLFIHPMVVNTMENTGLISFLFTQYLHYLLPVVLPYIYFLIVLLQSLRLNLLLNDLKMFNKSAFTTSLAFILLTAVLPQWASLSAALVANTFVIWTFIYLSKLYSSPQPKATLFNSGLVVGFSFLCYHPTIILMPVALFALAIIRPFKLSEWLVLLLGIITPLYIFVSLLYLNDKIPVFLTMLPNLHFNVPIKHTDVWVWIKLATILAVLLISLQFWSEQNNRMVIQLRKNWASMLVMLVIMLPIPFVFKNGSLESAVLCVVPLSAFIGHVFLYPKKALLPNLIFWALIVLIIHTNWLLGSSK